MKNKSIEQILSCAECGKEIQVQYSDKTYELLHDQGVCKKCGYMFCSDCLQIPVGMMRNSWSVSFRGYACIQCHTEGPPVEETYPNE